MFFIILITISYNHPQRNMKRKFQTWFLTLPKLSLHGAHFHVNNHFHFLGEWLIKRHWISIQSCDKISGADAQHVLHFYQIHQDDNQTDLMYSSCHNERGKACLVRREASSVGCYENEVPLPITKTERKWRGFRRGIWVTFLSPDERPIEFKMSKSVFHLSIESPVLLRTKDCDFMCRIAKTFKWIHDSPDDKRLCSKRSRGNYTLNNTAFWSVLYVDNEIITDKVRWWHRGIYPY